MWSRALTFFLAGSSFFLVSFLNLTASAQSIQKLDHNADAVGKASAPAPLALKSDTVITVHGVCNEEQLNTRECVTEISRQQFENLLKALNPDSRSIPAEARRNLARTYADYIAVRAAAQKSGLEETPELGALLEWTRLHAIADFYRLHLEQKYRAPSESEVKAYYKAHISEYERVELQRVLVPRQSPSAQDRAGLDRRAHAAAQSARARIASGADPSQVQREVYLSLGLSDTPSVAVGKRRRSEMLAEEASEIFALKPGETSRINTEIQNYAIYKVIARDTLPLEEVKDDIAREIYQRKFKDAMESVLEATPADFNTEYFGAPIAPARSAGPPEVRSPH